MLVVIIHILENFQQRVNVVLPAANLTTLHVYAVHLYTTNQQAIVITRKEKRNQSACSLSMKTLTGKTVMKIVMNTMVKMDTYSPWAKATMSPNFDIILGGSKIRALADSGASINIISKSDYHKLKEKPNLKRSKVCLYPYGAIQPLSVIGQFTQ